MQRKNEYVLVITDHYRNLTKTRRMKGISTAEVAKHFLNACVFNYGPPEELIGDNRDCFISKFFQDVCNIMNIAKNFSTKKHPQRNGKVGLYNRTI